MGLKAAAGGAVSGGVTAYSLSANYLGFANPYLNGLATLAGMAVGAGLANGAVVVAANALANAGRIKAVAYAVGGIAPAVSLILAGMHGALLPSKPVGKSDLEQLVLHAEQPTNIDISNETAKAMTESGIPMDAGTHNLTVAADRSMDLNGQVVPAEKLQEVLGKLYKRDPATISVLPGQSGHIELSGDAAIAAGNATGIGNTSALSVLEHFENGAGSGAYMAGGSAGILDRSQVAKINDVFDNGKLDGSFAKVSHKLNIGTPQDFADYVNVLSVAQKGYHFTLEEIFGHTPSEILNMSAARIFINDTYRQGGWDAVDLMKASLVANGANMQSLTENITAIRNDNRTNATDAQKRQDAVRYLVDVDFQLGKASVIPTVDSLNAFRDQLWQTRSAYLLTLGISSRAGLDGKSASDLVNISHETGILQQWTSERGNVSTYKLQELQSLGKANSIAVAGLTAEQLEALLPADALADYLGAHGVAVPENQKANRTYLGQKVDGLISAKYTQGFKDFAGKLGLDSPDSLDDLVAKVWEWNNASDNLAYNQGFADSMQARNEILYLMERNASYFAGMSDNAQASRELANWELARKDLDGLVKAGLLPTYQSNPWQSTKINQSTNASAVRAIADEKYAGPANKTLRNATVDYVMDFANSNAEWTVRIYNTTGNTSYLVRGWDVNGTFVRADRGLEVTDTEAEAFKAIVGRYGK